MRYDLKLVQELCDELGLRNAFADDVVEVDLGAGAVLCFVNAEQERDCLVGFKGGEWHAHDDFVFHDSRRNMGLRMNYLDVLTGLKDGTVLVCEQWKSGLLVERRLIHAEFNDESQAMPEGDELRIWRAPKREGPWTIQ